MAYTSSEKTSNNFPPVILERFDSRQIRRHPRVHHRTMQLERSTVLHKDGEIAVFDDKAANAVFVEADSQLKFGYPTIAVSSRITRGSQITIIEDTEPQIDVKVLSECVKPVPYRWKFQEDKIKTISPSKDGFHQRSNSPTFQRLVMATEKLHKHVNNYEINNGDKMFEENFLEKQSNETYSVAHPIKYDLSTQTSQKTQMGSVLKLTPLSLQEKNTELSKKEHRDFYIYEKDEEHEDYALKSASHEQLTPASPLANFQPVVTKKWQHEFKVDFRKLKSHSELHLFLPHIHESSTRTETPESPHRNSKITFMLPHIKGIVDAKSTEEEKSKSKRKQKYETRKKKKTKTRVKSGKVEKVMKDTLNEVPTLISLANDKDFHLASMCVLDNCAKHTHSESTGIRQS